jgi:hypothetical protein
MTQGTNLAYPLKSSLVLQDSVELSAKHRDFLLLNIFVLVQHGYIERAAALADALYILGVNTAQAVLARAVLQFFAQEWEDALDYLEELDRIAPIEKFGTYTMSNAQRMRRYLKARCLYELKDFPRSRDVVEIYLRHGQETSEAGE